MKNNSKKSKKPLQEIGDDAVKWEFFEEQFNINFNFKIKLENKTEKFSSEINLLDFVARSYAESSLTLSNKILNYSPNNSLVDIKYEAYRFLPAMFCFRHSVELRLKYFYMLIKRESFDNKHSLSELLKILKDNHFQSDIFDKAIEFINNFEGNKDEHFRYLIDTSFNCEYKIEIKKSDIENVIKFVKEIEKEYPKLKNKIRDSQTKIDCINQK